ncbi:hypothetical protein ACWT_3216 [Actinoplanes sp. SE50]|uniref:RNA polymerase sigma factor n=1 Tax=unclassified Actinoplanes TaxID=2626549 RepID=UPI00023EC95F|nr:MULTISPECIES: hypothetical protein [unclassified Actinoplanes]AEV84239.1 hypothetical protein ACPL_3344 [Actinoplanes sp. SE50/110]ATO82631.1 hypothetical protein ACWT_3216 [Actinoplanes sp. SE50]SLM00038.1 hypothetical protein ACSP50_3270 [Actinoplanes sp. SE50/110]
MTLWQRLTALRGLPAYGEILEFELFFRGRFPELVRFLMIKEDATLQDAEDAVEDAMSSAYRCWSKIDNPDAWVRQAAVHALIGIRRRDRRRRLALLAMRGQRTADSDLADSALHEEAEGVLAVLKKLPPAQREVLAYRLDGYPPGGDRAADRQGPADRPQQPAGRTPGGRRDPRIAGDRPRR